MRTELTAAGGTGPVAPAAPAPGPLGGARRIGAALAGLLVGLVAGVVYAEVQPVRYESSVQLLVGPIGAERATLDASGMLARTYAGILTSREMLDRVGAGLGAAVTTDDVTAVADERSRVILLVVTRPEADLAPRIADALAADLIVLVESSQPALTDPEKALAAAATGREPGQVRVLDEATNPATPRQSRPWRAIVTTAALGLVSGWLVALALDRGRSRRVDADWLGSALGLDAIALQAAPAPARPWKRRRRPGAGIEADACDLAMHRLLLRCDDRGPLFRTVVLLPLGDVPEVATLAQLLAAAGDRNGRPIHLAEADPATPVLPAGVVTVDASADGPGPADATGMIRMRWLAEVTPPGAVTLVLAPGLSGASRPVAAAVAADRVVLVARAGRSPRHELERLVRHLAAIEVAPVGVMLVDPTVLAGPPITPPQRPAAPAPIDLTAAPSPPAVDAAPVEPVPDGLAPAEAVPALAEPRPVGSEVSS